MGAIVVIDDDSQLRQSFGRLLEQEGYRVRTAGSAEAGIEAVRQDMPDLVIMDVRLPGMDGLTAFGRLHELEPRLPVIIMTAYGGADTAIEATRRGAFDFVLKPFDIPEMLALIAKALEAGRAARARVDLDAAPDSGSEDAMVGKSPAMQEVYKAIGRVAATEATVLIRGESGTGKELVARAIHQHSPRRDKPLTVINCVAIPETLLESELFGYEKGAFTGAASRRAGKIELAAGGAVFLDEIGDMPFAIQSKLLRLLEEKTVERLGGAGAAKVDVRIIAATNRNLEEAIAQGRFREDLYYRLRVVTLRLPPLRERMEDLPLLANHLVARHAQKLGAPNPGVAAEAVSALAAHDWPGNVRELSNVLHKALIFGRGAPVGAAGVRQAMRGETPVVADADAGLQEALARWVRQSLSAAGPALFENLTDHIAALIITEALKATGNNRTHAAKLLGLSRPTLIAKIEKYGL
ncbi:MAG: sigma-54 dependent transcriptional regulator [Thermodesulfobacteriota bacterium]